MRPCDYQMVLRKRLVAANDAIRACHNDGETKIAIFTKPTRHFCERLFERVPQAEHDNVVDMIIKYVRENNTTLARRADGELTINSKRYSVKLKLDPVHHRTRFDEKGNNTKVVILLSVLSL